MQLAATSRTHSPSRPPSSPVFRRRLRCVALVAAIAAGADTGPAFAAPFVYVLGRQSGSPRINVLTVIDAATNAKGPRITLGTSNGCILPQLMVMAPDGARIYVANDLASTISVVSTSTNMVEDTWPTSLVGASPRALAISPDGARLYVARQNGSLVAIDVASKTVIADLALNFGSVFGLAASPDGSRVYAMATGSSTLVTLGAAPFRVLTTLNLDLEVRLLRGDVAVTSPDGRFVYLPQATTWEDTCGGNPNCIPLSPPLGALTSRVAVVDTSTNAIVATTTVSPNHFQRLYHLAVSPDGTVVYTTGSTPLAFDQQLYRLSPTTQALSRSIRLRQPPYPVGRAIAFVPDSSRAYVAASDGVYPVDTSNDTVGVAIPFAIATDGTPNAVVVTPPPPPEPPSNLRAVVDGSRVTLTWDAPAAGGAGGYMLEGGLTPGSVIASIPTGRSTPGFTFDAPSGAFYIRIHAVGGGRRSSASNEIQILVNVPRPPSSPTNLRGLTNGSDLVLSWTNTTSGGSPSSLLLDVSGAVTASLPLSVIESFSFSGVPSGTYTFAVRAANATGSSLATSTVTLTFPGECPGAPQAPTNLTVIRQGAQLSVNWDPPSSGAAVSSYLLNVTGAVNLSLPMAARTISGVVSPGTYQLSVQALNPCGTGSVSTTQSVTVP